MHKIAHGCLIFVELLIQLADGCLQGLQLVVERILDHVAGQLKARPMSPIAETRLAKCYGALLVRHLLLQLVHVALYLMDVIHGVLVLVLQALFHVLRLCDASLEGLVGAIRLVLHVLTHLLQQKIDICAQLAGGDQSLGVCLKILIRLRLPLGQRELT